MGPRAQLGAVHQSRQVSLSAARALLLTRGAFPLHPHRRALFQIHICVVLWGFTAILGKLITLPALALVWWRLLLVSLALLCFPRVWRALRAMPPRLMGIYGGIGCVVAVHWITFYGAVKLA